MKDKFGSVVSWVIVLTIVLTVYFVLRRLGLAGNPPSEAEEVYEDHMADVLKAEEFMKKTEFLDPNFWKGRVFVNLTSNQLQMLATNIYDSWHWYGDDEASVYAVFESIKSGEQLSQLADAYSLMYKTSLRGKLFEKLDGDEIHQIYLIIKSYK